MSLPVKRPRDLWLTLLHCCNRELSERTKSYSVVLILERGTEDVAPDGLQDFICITGNKASSDEDWNVLAWRLLPSKLQAAISAAGYAILPAIVSRHAEACFRLTGAGSQCGL